MNRKPSIDLTSEEQTLLDQIDFSPSGPAMPSLRVSPQLVHRLLQRDVIPKIRLRYFTDPELNIGPKCSRKEMFERNGTRGEAIFSHGHFLPYLQYFIFGPDLPIAAINDFQARVQESGGYVSGSDFPDLDAIIRQVIRTHGLDPRDAAEEFYKLALECELEPFLARHFRDVAKAARP